MSILTTDPETAEAFAVRQFRTALRRFRTSMLDDLEACVLAVVAAPGDVPAQSILDAIGSDAANVLTMFSGAASFLSAALTLDGDTDGLARLGTISSLIPSHTVNEDGTVTIATTEETEE